MMKCHRSGIAAGSVLGPAGKNEDNTQGKALGVSEPI